MNEPPRIAFLELVGAATIAIAFIAFCYWLYSHLHWVW